MPKFAKRKRNLVSIVTDKFVEVCDELVSKKVVKNDRALAAEIHSTPNVISDIRKGTRNVTLDLIITVCTKYSVNCAFLLPPWEKSIFREENTSTLIKMKRASIEAQVKELENLERLLDK